jgi:hypothetical protein
MSFQAHAAMRWGIAIQYFLPGFEKNMPLRAGTPYSRRLPETGLHELVGNRNEEDGECPFTSG